MASPGKNDFFQGFYLDWPLYRGILCRSKGECLYKVASPGKNDFFQGFYLDWPLYRGILCRSKGECLYKVASPSKNDFFQGFYLGYKVASPGIFFFSGFTWTGHFIEVCSVGGGGIKFPVQVKMCFFQRFYLDWPLYRGILCWGRGYKVASPT